MASLAEIRAGNRKSQAARHQARKIRKERGKAYVKIAVPLPKSKAHPVSKYKVPLSYVAKSPTKSKAHPVTKYGVGTKYMGKKDAIATPKAHPITKYGVGTKYMGKSSTGLNNVVPASASRSATYNGGYAVTHANPGAIRGTPKTAKLVTKSARKVPLSSTTPPMPAGKPSFGFRFKAALATGKDNQALALKRMKATNRN